MNGDIVNIEYKKATVEKAKIEYHGASFYGCTDSDMWEIDDYYSVKKLGNIYDNKNLLEEK